MSRWFARAMSGPALQAVSWRDSNRMFLATFIGILAAVYIFILLVDPYGMVPFSLPFDRPIVSAQRQMYPQILRTGRYDSIVVGTSTSRLLDPAALSRVLRGHFANLAMPDATAWEQIQVLDYFRRTVAVPNALVIGLDHEWCNRRSSSVADSREKEFPSWAYDENRWNDFLYLLNNPTLEAAGRTIGRILGATPEKLRNDGFTVFVPPDATYDLARAQYHIWGPKGPHPIIAAPQLQLSEAERHAMAFPALAWLDESLAAVPGTTKKVLLFPPVHASSIVAAGSHGEARETECKTRATAIARQRGAMAVDWRFVSSLTAKDTNFWDQLHYRLPVAYRLIDDLEHVVTEGRESLDGSYRILVR